MNFIVRGVKREDLSQLNDLAKQFTLLNLPDNKQRLLEKIELSIDSFNGELSKDKAEYLFVIEDVESEFIAGSAQIVAKHGTKDNPNYSFKVLKKERFSHDLGIGFIHQILRLRANTDGCTEVGGLVVDRGYRRRPEKLGRVISLIRFCYIGMFPDRFGSELHSEMAPPLTEEGRSEFWEALGRRFTGMPYAEADLLSQNNKEFIESLFPEEDIYLSLLDSKARITIGRVGEETRPALHMLEKIGFKYKEEIDPFDGGPHLGCPVKDIHVIRDGKFYDCQFNWEEQYDSEVLLGISRKGEFIGGTSSAKVKKNKVYLPKNTKKVLKLKEGDKIYLSPLS